MHYHLILTEKCNLQCKYCYEKSMQEFDNGLQDKFEFDLTEPCVSQVNIQKLKSFIEKDPEPKIIFYGGEPLLQIEKIKQVIKAIPNIPYRMQTNGQLLDKLEPEYLNKITKILISIDGNQETTDKYRGKGTYQKIINNIKLIRQNGYTGELIARMTVAQDNPNICKNVLDILETKLFDSIHWQLDVGFYKTDFEKNKIKSFLSQYDESITKLIEYWVTEIKNQNYILMYPFTAIAESILTGEKTKLRCGAGHSGYAITTSGKIVACPIMNNIENFKAGNLETNPSDLKKFNIEECDNCEAKKLCGGRCLYWRKAKLWSKEGDELICNSIKHYINEIKNQIPEIKKYITKEQLKYEKYFGPEIIP
jgi:uncharacterized protein